MTPRPPDTRARRAEAQARVARIAALFESIAGTLDQMIEDLGRPGGPAPRALHIKLGELQTAHLKLIAAEEAFDAEFGADERADFDGIRREIGRRLDRLRAGLDAEGLHRQSE